MVMVMVLCQWLAGPRQNGWRRQFSSGRQRSLKELGDVMMSVMDGKKDGRESPTVDGGESPVVAVGRRLCCVSCTQWGDDVEEGQEMQTKQQALFSRRLKIVSFLTVA